MPFVVEIQVACCAIALGDACDVRWRVFQELLVRAGEKECVGIYTALFVFTRGG